MGVLNNDFSINPEELTEQEVIKLLKKPEFYPLLLSWRDESTNNTLLFFAAQLQWTVVCNFLIQESLSPLESIRREFLYHLNNKGENGLSYVLTTQNEVLWERYMAYDECGLIVNMLHGHSNIIQIERYPFEWSDKLVNLFIYHYDGLRKKIELDEIHGESKNQDKEKLETLSRFFSAKDRSGNTALAYAIERRDLFLCSKIVNHPSADEEIAKLAAATNVLELLKEHPKTNKPARRFGFYDQVEVKDTIQEVISSAMPIELKQV